MPDAIFYNRNFVGTIGLLSPARVLRYSWHMVGGPDKAYLSIPATGDQFDMFKLLRCPVEIYGSDGRLNWYGYVNRVTIPRGEQRIGMGLDLMYNSITFTYGSGAASVETAAIVDSINSDAYGLKEHKLFDSNATEAQALQARNVFYYQHRFPPTEIEFSGGKDDIQIECYGWYKTLDWRYYTDAETGDVENAAQIDNIVSAVSQFLAGTELDDVSGISSKEERDGKRTALDYVNQLLSAGTTNYQPLLATVDSKRYLHVYERDVVPAAPNADYLLLPDNNLMTPLGSMVEPEHCICAAWIRLADSPIQHTANANVAAFFIETSEYNAETDKTTYRPAGAYEQMRLAKYIRDTIDNNHDTPPPTTAPTFAVDTYAYYTLQDGAVSSFSNTGVIYSVNDYSTGSAVNMDMTVSQDGLYLIGCNVWHNGGLNDSAWGAIWGVADSYLKVSVPAAGDYSDPENIKSAAASAVGVVVLAASDTLSIVGAAINNSTWGSVAPGQFHWFVLKIA